MTALAEMARDLRAHLMLGEEILQLVARENQQLRTPDTAPHFESCQRRKLLLLQLDDALATLKRHRLHWQHLTPAARQAAPEISGLIRANQDLIMKIIMFDRENEQWLLRRGLLPATQLPSAARQQPHFVSQLYKRHDPR